MSSVLLPLSLQLLRARIQALDTEIRDDRDNGQSNDRVVSDELINILERYLCINYVNVAVITDTDFVERENDQIRALYLDLPLMSWSGIHTMLNSYCNTEVLIIKTRQIVGGTNTFVNMISSERIQNNLKVLLIMIDGSYRNTTVETSVFFREWNQHIGANSFAESLHVYYQTDPTIPDSLADCLDKLLIVGSGSGSADLEKEILV